MTFRVYEWFQIYTMFDCKTSSRYPLWVSLENVATVEVFREGGGQEELFRQESADYWRDSWSRRPNLMVVKQSAPSQAVRVQLSIPLFR